MRIIILGGEGWESRRGRGGMAAERVGAGVLERREGVAMGRRMEDDREGASEGIGGTGGTGVYERIVDWVCGDGVCERTGIGVCERIEDGVGVWDRAAIDGALGVTGREDAYIEADLM